MVKSRIKINLYLFIIINCSLIGGIYQGQYIVDSYHWGLILSNALELIDGKIPYKEIFIQYGLLSTIIHAIVLIIFKKNIFSLVVFTSLIYAASLYLIGQIAYHFIKNKIYSLYAVLCIFFINPWPTSPWPNFISYFFIIMFFYFYLKNSLKNNIISGIFLAFSYLSLTYVYSFIIAFFYLSLLTIILIFRRQIDKNSLKKHFYIFITFALTIFVFFIYLLNKNIFEIWLTYQKIPFVLADYYGITLKSRIIEYINFLFIYSFSNIIYEPQFIFFSIIFIINTFYLFKFTILFFRNGFSKINFDFLILNILIFSLNFKAQIYGMDKLATSLSLGVITLMHFINNERNQDNKIIYNFIIFFVVIFSSLFCFEMRRSDYSGNRYLHFQYLKNTQNTYRNNNIPYFTSQKWSKNTWYPLLEFINYQEKIKKKCNIEYAANLTSESYFFVLIKFKKIQIIPFVNKTHKYTFIKHFEPYLIRNIQKEINKNNIILLSFENNDKDYSLKNYYISKKINLNKFNDKIEQYIYIFLPTNCLIN